MVIKVGKYKDIRIRVFSFSIEIVLIFVGSAMMIVDSSPYLKNMFEWGLFVVACGIYVLALESIFYFIRKRRIQKYKNIIN